MVPDIDLQLTVVIKALREVVAPAVDPANAVAGEQLHLAIATLQMVQAGAPYAHALARCELRNALALAEAVHRADETLGLGDAAVTAGALLADPGAAQAELIAARLALQDVISGAVRASAGTASQRAVARAVLSASQGQVDLARAWCASAGFDPEANRLPPISEWLAERGASEGQATGQAGGLQA